MAGHRLTAAEAARRRTIFLHHLAQSANVKAAARAAGCQPMWLYQLKRRDPAFAASWTRASAAASSALDSGCGALGGDQVVRHRPTGDAQAIKRRRDGWSARKERRFIDELAATSNVLAAALAAGVAPSTAYKRRRLHPRFARDWDEALGEARTIIHAKLQRQAMNGVREREDGALVIAEGDEERAIPDPRFLLQLLRFHDANRARRAAAPTGADDQTDEAHIQEVMGRLDRLRDHLDRHGTPP